LALTGFYAGLRIGEMVALDVDDLHLTARLGQLTVRAGKRRRLRQVPVHPVLREALQRWVHTRPPTASSALFPNTNGARLTSRGAHHILTRLAAGADLRLDDDVTFSAHMLRHTAATRMVRSGVDLIIVADILGHSVEMLRRYAAPTAQDRHDAVTQLMTDA
jgi:integrase/recombinase XerC